MLNTNINRKKLPIALHDKNFWRLALSLALPIAFQNMLVSSFSLIDTLMVNRLGEIQLSATGMAGQWSWLFSIVLFGISSGASIFVSQYWGDKNVKGIHRTTGIAITAGLIISLPFMLAGLLIPDKIIYIFNKDPRVIEYGAMYLRYASLSYPAIALTNIFGAVLRSTERPKLPMVASGIGAVINVILNYLLIFTAGLGVQGAAIATVISAWVGLIIIIAISVVRKNILCAPLSDIFSFSGKTLVEFFKKTTPVIINESMWGLGTFVYNIIFANIGYEEYAAITIVKIFENFSFCFFLGIGNACCVLIGKSVGAGEIREGARDSKRFMILCPIVAAVTGLATILLRAPLVSIFNIGGNTSSYTIETAEWLLVIVGAWMIVRNISYLTVVGIFRPGGDATFGMVMELLLLWCFAVPMTYMAANVWELPFLAVYIVMYLCEDIPKSLVFIPYWISGRWIKPVTDAGKVGLEFFKKDE